MSNPDTPRSAEEGQQRKIIERLRAAIFDDERIEPTSRLKEAYNEIAMELMRVQRATPASEPLPEWVEKIVARIDARGAHHKTKEEEALVYMRDYIADRLSTPTTPVPTGKLTDPAFIEAIDYLRVDMASFKEEWKAFPLNVQTSLTLILDTLAPLRPVANE